MLKPVAPAINAVGAVAEIKPLAALGDAYEDGEPWTARLVQGQTYAAQVRARLGEQVYRVVIEGRPLALALQGEVATGQSLRLQYLGNQPAPAFALLPPAGGEQADAATLSAAGQLITRHLRAAGNDPAADIYQAALAVGRQPADANQLAADLRHAVATSGLFYEAHLAEFAEGTRPLAELMQEPQNADSTAANALLPKQLGILEHQRLLWHGEIWPGQLMQWQLRVDPQHRPHQEAQEAETGERLTSSISLELPHLGHVSIRLEMRGADMHVLLAAEDGATAACLGAAGAELRAALAGSVPGVHTVAVQQHAPE